MSLLFFEAGITIGFNILQGERPDKGFILPGAPLAIVDIMTRCWDGERTKRPIFQGNIYHNYFILFLHLLQGRGTDLQSGTDPLLPFCRSLVAV